MKLTYTRKQGKNLTYNIVTDKHGSLWISLGDKPLLTIKARQDYFGKPKWGSKALELEAATRAQMEIEFLRGMDEE